MIRCWRVLLLICGLPLLLPPGWCCTLQAASTPASAPVRNCCCDCQKRHGDRPTPQPAEQCPCVNRAATAPTLQKVTPPTAAFAFASLAPFSTEQSTEAPRTRIASSPAVSNPLHILNCSWR